MDKNTNQFISSDSIYKNALTQFNTAKENLELYHVSGYALAQLKDKLDSLNTSVNEILINNQVIINKDISTRIKSILNSINQVNLNNLNRDDIFVDTSDLVNPIKEISDTVEKLELSSEEASISDNHPIIIVNNFISNDNNKKIDLPTFINLVYTVIALIVMLSQHFDKIETDKLFLDALNGIGSKISTSIDNND